MLFCRRRRIRPLRPEPPCGRRDDFSAEPEEHDYGADLLVPDRSYGAVDPGRRHHWWFTQRICAIDRIE
jgi:hypothetical protein